MTNLASLKSLAVDMNPYAYIVFGMTLGEYVVIFVATGSFVRV